MNRTCTVNAIEGMCEDGFAIDEATRIRPYLPRHFSPFPSLHRTNIHAWEVFRAVKDALQYECFEFKFIHTWPSGEPLNHFHFQQNDFIEYVSPTYHTRFLSIEFVRHFGDALYTERGVNPNDGRQLVHVNGGLRLKMNTLRSVYDNLQKPTRDIPTYCTGRDHTPFLPPIEIDSPEKAVTALRAGWQEWFNLNNPSGGAWQKYTITTQAVDKAMFQSLCKQLDPTLVNLDSLVSHATPFYDYRAYANSPIQPTVHFNWGWLSAIHLPDGTLVGKLDRDDLIAVSGSSSVNEHYPSVFYHRDSRGNYYGSLIIPRKVYDLFPREDWLRLFGG